MKFKAKSGIAILLFVVVLGYICSQYWIANQRKLVNSRNLHQCRENIRNMKSALELYNGDNGGRYPPELGFLVPLDIMNIPNCPSAGSDTYSSGYTISEERSAFTICCKGKNHPGFPSDYPLLKGMNLELRSKGITNPAVVVVRSL
jgi:hypothetical protein